MELRHLVEHEIDAVVIGPAAQEGERIAVPIRHPKAEHVGVELHHLLHVVDAIGHVAELERHDAGLAAVLGGEDVVGEHLDQRALGIGERDGLGDAGRYAAAALGPDPVLAPARATSSSRSLPGAT